MNFKKKKCRGQNQILLTYTKSLAKTLLKLQKGNTRSDNHRRVRRVRLILINVEKKL